VIVVHGHYKKIEEENILLKLEDTIVGRAKVTKSSNRYLIALTINDNESVLR